MKDTVPFHLTRAGRPRSRPLAFASAFCALALVLALTASVFAYGAGSDAPRVAVASGETVVKKEGMQIDASHADQGYVMVRSSGKHKRLKLRFALGETQYTYDLSGDGEYEVFPLQMGSGTYKISLFEQVSGSKYTSLSSVKLKMSLADENGAYLYPNQYVNYDADTQAVILSEEVCAGLTSDQARADAVFEYLTRHLVYNYMRALTVEKGYLPDLDAVLNDKMGICFDFAALMACMLRVQDVPTRLIIGYADNTYHAWNMVLLGGEWTRYDATAEVTNANIREYTEERRY